MLSVLFGSEAKIKILNFFLLNEAQKYSTSQICKEIGLNAAIIRRELVNIEKTGLIKKDTNQLKQIIGDPSWRENTAQIWTYDMGYGGGSGFDFLFHNLKITFNKKGKVISVEHLEIRD